MATANQRISEYVLDARVGGGTFGEVWRAHHHVWIDQLVAIKIPTDPQYLRSLQREGSVIHGLVHPNIVRAMGFDPYAPVPYLVMEYVPGTSLRPLISAKKLSPADVVSIMRQVLAGLKYAHSQNLIHRDIKPENILVHERALKEGFAAEGVIKITDFGLGKAVAGTVMGSIAYSQSMNSPAGADIAGTLDYMSPEQRTGTEPDGRADLYSCGVMLYELLTGERPAGTDVPSDVNPATPKWLDEVFKRSYARRDRRFKNADEFLAALGSASPPPLPKQPRVGAAMAPKPPPIPSVQAQESCPQCRHAAFPGDQFCMSCGVQLVPLVRRCQQCGGYPDPKDVYCVHCGASLTVAGSVV